MSFNAICENKVLENLGINSILRSLDETNALKLLGVMYKDKKLNLVSEFVDGGTLTLYLLVSSADNLCKHSGPRPGLTTYQA